MVTAGFCSFPLLVPGFAQTLSGLIWFPEPDGSRFLFCLIVGLFVVFCFFLLLFHWFSELNWLIEGIDRHPEGKRVPSWEWSHPFQQREVVQLIWPVSWNSSLFKFWLTDLKKKLGFFFPFPRWENRFFWFDGVLLGGFLFVLFCFSLIGWIISDILDDSYQMLSGSSSWIAFFNCYLLFLLFNFINSLPN